MTSQKNGQSQKIRAKNRQFSQNARLNGHARFKKGDFSTLVRHNVNHGPTRKQPNQGFPGCLASARLKPQALAPMSLPAAPAHRVLAPGPRTGTGGHYLI